MEDGSPRGGRIELSGVSKSFGDHEVLRDVQFTIEAGEFFSLLGPSGCGKTTTLRLIAGFEHPDAGVVSIDGIPMDAVPPERRPVNTVFQSYALFPHLDVAGNVGFGLRFSDVPRSERRQRVGEALELVRMSDYASRRPHQLSGGQQQRVALARSLVLRPKVLLLDEPLGALDAQLRRALQDELRTLHREVGITFVYVTHDQEEALTMSDRLAVMRAGRIEQVGDPQDVYDEPVTAFVADFLGHANLAKGRVVSEGVLELGGVRLDTRTGGVPPGARCTVLIRPERLRLKPYGSGVLHARVEQIVFAGPVTRVRVRVGDLELETVVPNDGASLPGKEGEMVDISLGRDAVRLLID
jgi:spermidine/putrescine transport system ATP-binding protein